ncbi:MAG: hypothetical protein AB1571_04055 [Nanoarchaeota archaeon]
MEEKDYYAKINTNSVADLKEIGLNEFELNGFYQDNGLFSSELKYSRKNLRDRGMLNLVKWKFRQYYNEAINKIKEKHLDP